jgi:hypothetical protein
MRKVLLLGLVAIIGVLGISTVALADRGGDDGNVRHFSARLDGWEEDPSQVTTGRGSFEAEVLSPTLIHFTLSYEDMEGPVSAAHIHIGSRHESGGVSAFLCGGGPGAQPPCPTGPDGSLEWDIEPADIAGPVGQGVEPGNMADLLRAVRRGETYTNVHTTGRAPGGEIRGQNRRGGGHDD